MYTELRSAIWSTPTASGQPDLACIAVHLGFLLDLLLFRTISTPSFPLSELYHRPIPISQKRIEQLELVPLLPFSSLRPLSSLHVLGTHNMNRPGLPTSRVFNQLFRLRIPSQPYLEAIQQMRQRGVQLVIRQLATDAAARALGEGDEGLAGEGDGVACAWKVR